MPRHPSAGPDLWWSLRNRGKPPAPEPLEDTSAVVSRTVAMTRRVFFGANNWDPKRVWWSIHGKKQANIVIFSPWNHPNCWANHRTLKPSDASLSEFGRRIKMSTMDLVVAAASTTLISVNSPVDSPSNTGWKWILLRLQSFEPSKHLKTNKCVVTNTDILRQKTYHCG